MTQEKQAHQGKLQTRIERLRLKDLKLLKHNARYMRHEQFQRLVQNVRQDGCLTSAPFACREPDDSYLVLSGNHRVKAAIEAGLEEADVIVTDDLLTPDQKVAIQLDHNAIAGDDDVAVLQQLFDSINSVDARLYTGLDDKILGLLDEAPPPGVNELNLDYQVLAFTFLPGESAKVEKALKMAMTDAGVLSANQVLIGRFREYDKLLDALELVRNKANVKNVATGLMIILDVFMRHVEEVTPEMAKRVVSPDVCGVSIANAPVYQAGEPVATLDPAPSSADTHQHEEQEEATGEPTSPPVASADEPPPKTDFDKLAEILVQEISVAEKFDLVERLKRGKKHPEFLEKCSEAQEILEKQQDEEEAKQPIPDELSSNPMMKIDPRQFPIRTYEEGEYWYAIRELPDDIELEHYDRGVAYNSAEAINDLKLSEIRTYGLDPCEVNS